MTLVESNAMGIVTIIGQEKDVVKVSVACLQVPCGYTECFRCHRIDDVLEKK